MDTTHFLCDLVEAMEDTIAIHDNAARSSTGDLRLRREKSVFPYTAMLNEVIGWEERRKRERSLPIVARTSESASDGFSALIDRIYGMYRMQSADDSLANAGWRLDGAVHESLATCVETRTPVSAGDWQQRADVDGQALQT